MITTDEDHNALTQFIIIIIIVIVVIIIILFAQSTG